MVQEQDIQKKYMEYQALEQHINQLQQQLMAVNEHMHELLSLSESLGQISKTKPKTNSFSQLGPGVFIESEIKNTKRLLMNVGANIAVFKSVDEVKSAVENQLSEMHNVINKINSDIEKFTLYHSNLQNELQGMVSVQ